MDAIFMNSEDNKTSCTHKLLFNLSDKIDLKKGDKYVALSNLRIYYTWENIKLNKNNKSKISAPTQNEVSELPDGSYYVSEIQEYCEYIFKKHE